jgi:uncharacterized protein (DUF952 family)
MTRLLYHLASRAEWAAAEAEGVYRGSPDDRRDGFIHFSTEDQVRASAARHRAGHTDLLLLAAPEDAVGPWRWEKARSGALFPHLYAPLPVSAVVSVEALPLGPDGLHQFPPFAASWS